MGCKAMFEYLKQMIRQDKPMVIGIMEPKQNSSKLAEYASKLGFTRYGHKATTNTHIWIFWKDEIVIDILDCSAHHVTIQVGGQQNFRLSFVHVRCDCGERLELWDFIRQYNSAEMPWFVGGYFNTILRVSEKKGGLPPDPGSIQDFQECINIFKFNRDQFQGASIYLVQ